MTGEAVLFFTLLVLAGLVLSALCSGIETGIYSLNRVRLAMHVARGDRRALVLRDEIDHPNRLLAGLLIANTIASDVVAIGMSRLFDGLEFGAITAVVVNTVVVVPLLFVFGEVLPKDLFRRIADRAIPAMAPALRAARLVLTWSGLVPLVQAASGLLLRRLGATAEAPLSSRQRLARIFEEGAGSGALTEEQVSLAERVLGVTGRTVTERMVPWRRAVTLRGDLDRRGRMAAIQGGALSRFPVVSQEGRVLGIVAALDLLVMPDRSIPELMRPACWVPPSMSLFEALESLRRARAKLAIVGTPERTPIGVISLNDLVEPLVGSFKGDL